MKSDEEIKFSAAVFACGALKSLWKTSVVAPLGAAGDEATPQLRRRAQIIAEQMDSLCADLRAVR